MGIFSNLFGRKACQTDAVDAEGEGRNSAHEKEMSKHFSLKFHGTRWAYEGRVNQDYATQLGNPEICLAILQALRTQLGFDQICVLAGNPVSIVCNSKPPLAIVTSLNASDTATLVATIFEATRVAPFEYQGAFCLRLA